MSEQSRLTERIRRRATRREAGARGSSGDSASSRMDRIGPLGGVALAIVLSAQFVVVLDFSIVNVALPSISRELHASSTSVQWVVTAYAITFGGLLVLGGRAADLFGRRRLFVAGLSGSQWRRLRAASQSTCPCSSSPERCRASQPPRWRLPRC